MLPELIEIIPLERPVRAAICVPGSKSITNRALILAALAQGETVLQGALWSEDTQVMVAGLEQLGFGVSVQMDPTETSNRTITVLGQGGRIPLSGTESKPLDLFVGNAGTAARFLAALVCLGSGVYRLHGVPRMHDRPQAALFDALRELGYRVQSPNQKLPVVIHGAGPHTGRCRVSIAESSQFASALLLCAAQGGWSIQIADQNADESAYVSMTTKLIAGFPERGGAFQVEPDASSGSYFFGAAWLAQSNLSFASPCQSDSTLGSDISVTHWPTSGWQIDARFRELLWAPASEGAERTMPKHLPAKVSRELDLGDSIMTAIVLAPFMPRPTRFTDLGRLRLQETERVAALRTELTKCGAQVSEQGNCLEVAPSPLHGAEIETYNDHRMAMCFAILGLKVPGIKIQNPACVKKTFPNFFQKLAAPPPAGLGLILCEGHTGRALCGAELFAENPH